MPARVVARIFDSIAEIDRAQWDHCFQGELEAWDYYHAVEQARLTGFDLCYPTLWDGERLVAAVPAFFTAYRLDTTVTGRWKRLTDRIAAFSPRLLSLPMACLGSPVGEVCHLGFAPEVSPAERPALLRRLMAEFEAHAGRLGVGFVAVKDAPDSDMALWSACLEGGYQRIPSLPTATLPLGFDTLDGYLASLSRATRKNVKRKLRERERVTVEWRDNIDDVLPEVMAIYAETLGRSDVQFEELTPAYFQGLLAGLGGRACCVLYWVEGRLAGFNLLLCGEDRLIDKFIGLREGLGREVNLYVLSWITNVEYCLARGIPLYHSGQAEYTIKRQLGSQFAANWLLFRHRKPLLNSMLRVVGHLVRIDRHDAEVAAMAQDAA